MTGKKPHRLFSARHSSRTLALLFACAALANCDETASSSVQFPIIGGEQGPAALGAAYQIDAWQQNAVLSLRQTFGAKILACSATLVADRLAMTASHCVMSNFEKWWVDGDAPQVAAAQNFSLTVVSGDDAPCALKVERVTMHPDTLRQFAGRVIDNDIAMLVLGQSAVTTCPVLPIPMSAKPNAAADQGRRFLVSGFGITEVGSDAVGIRRWGEVELVTVSPFNFIFRDVGKGLPASGDSGGGVFEVNKNVLSVFGISSTVVPPHMAGTNINGMLSYVKASAQGVPVCPDQLLKGMCRDNKSVVCAAAGFTVTDCGATGRLCVDTPEGGRCVDPSSSAEASPTPLDSGVAADDGAATTPTHGGGCQLNPRAPEGSPWLFLALLLLLVRIVAPARRRAAPRSVARARTRRGRTI